MERSGTWPMVRFPKEAISRVLTNLLENAITYSGRPGERNAIWLGATREGEKVTLTVSDNGPGIPAEYRERVFGLFKKLNPRGEGAGVGLTIVKRIVERHGGKVWVDDSEHGGAAVSLTLPAAAGASPDGV